MGAYRAFAERALEAVGGASNIEHVTHCATRLRITCVSEEKVREDLMEDLPQCAGAVFRSGQVQFIIGPKIPEAYNEFLSVSGWGSGQSAMSDAPEKPPHDAPSKAGLTSKGAVYWLNKFSNFVAPVFMPVIPALITGGMILAIKTLLVNYFGVSTDGGVAQLMLTIFEAGFHFLPVYVGYTLARQLKMQPIMGAFLGAVLVSTRFASGTVTDFFGIPIPQVAYASTIIPVVLGIAFMYWVDKLLGKVLPEAIVYFMKPILTMIVVVPVELIVLGPLGNQLSGYVASAVLWMSNTLGPVALPVLVVVYPYMVMFGLDKGLHPIGIELLSSIGYNPVTVVIGFISNICVGATALALATTTKDKARRGVITSSGITALCGVTEPAFYGSLISQPRVLVGTAIGGAASGLFAGIFGLRTFIHGGCPGFFTLPFFIDGNGGFFYVVIALVTSAIGIAVSFVATRVILARAAKGEDRHA